jgi:hypothetical protein
MMGLFYFSEHIRKNHQKIILKLAVSECSQLNRLPSLLLPEWDI